MNWNSERFRCYALWFSSRTIVNKLIIFYREFRGLNDDHASRTRARMRSYLGTYIGLNLRDVDRKTANIVTSRFWTPVVRAYGKTVPVFFPTNNNVLTTRFSLTRRSFVCRATESSNGFRWLFCPFHLERANIEHTRSRIEVHVL
jgi:hypothetical protein